MNVSYNNKKKKPDVAPEDTGGMALDVRSCRWGQQLRSFGRWIAGTLDSSIKARRGTSSGRSFWTESWRYLAATELDELPAW